MLDLFSNPLHQAVAGLIAIIVLALLITCGVFYFKSMYYENQANKEKEKREQIEKENELYKAQAKAYHEAIKTNEELRKKQQITQKKLNDAQKEAEIGKKKLEEALKEREKKELTGEYTYDKCPDTKKEIELLNSIISKSLGDTSNDKK